ncbi:MAG: DUF2249 domain-containing protein [Rhodospirillales bacterium]|jgi:hypothetical protein|nr:DUF2249 domain-containing protein [Rhodospirillales bacterium]
MGPWFPSKPDTPRPALRTEADLWPEDGDTHIDTRAMEPPGPAVAILTQLESMGDNAQLIAYLDREPIFLFPELEERDWSWEIENKEPGDVRLRIFRWAGD